LFTNASFDLAVLREALRQNFDLLWRYRFFYRELGALVRHDRPLGKRHKAIQEQRQREQLALFDRLAAAGVASILIPFPHAVDDHQTSNARFLAKAGAAILLPQAELTPERLALIRNLTREQLLQMAEKARALAKPEATLAVVNVCKELAR